MEPRIGSALSAGFRAANRSWAGIGFFGGTMLLVTVVSLFAIAATNPPALRPAGEEPAALPAPAVPAPAAPAVEPSVSPAAPAPAPDSAPPAAASDVNLFNQLETASQPPAIPADTAPPPADEHDRAVRAWLGRVWPLALFIVLVMLAVNVWLSGGQIGYLAARINGQPAPLALFWQEGARAFGRLLGAWALMMGSGIAVLLVLALASALLAPLPEGVRRVLGWLVLLALGAAGAWLLVRLSFWFIAVVVDRVGPVAGLKTSWRATKGRWLKTAGLGLLIGLISVGVSLAFGLVEGLGNLIGGAAAVVLGVGANLTGLVASLYIGFAALAAYIRFYQDVKGQGAASSG